jgi:hypothetical protein
MSLHIHSKKLQVKTSPSAGSSHLHTYLPVLFLTATYNQKAKKIETLAGLQFDCSSNIFWPTTVATMHHGNVCLRAAYTAYPLYSFKQVVGPALETSLLQKYIWYANNCVAIKQHTKMLGTWIGNQRCFKSNIVSVTGTQMKEQKLHHTNLFAATNLPNLSLLECNDVTQPFNTQILLATTGAANAGLGNLDIYGVAGRAKFPPNFKNVLQERGHAGRCPTALPPQTYVWFVFH